MLQTRCELARFICSTAQGGQAINLKPRGGNHPANRCILSVCCLLQSNAEQPFASRMRSRATRYPLLGVKRTEPRRQSSHIKYRVRPIKTAAVITLLTANSNSPPVIIRTCLYLKGTVLFTHLKTVANVQALSYVNSGYFSAKPKRLPACLGHQSQTADIFFSCCLMSATTDCGSSPP